MAASRHRGFGAIGNSAIRSADLENPTLELEVAADWHELMIPWRIVRPSIAHANEQLDPRCSTQTYHRPNQPH